MGHGQTAERSGERRGRGYALGRRKFLAQAGAAMTVGAVPGVAGQAWASGHETARRRRRQPNIVLVVADDLGWNEVGAYGQDLIQTPVLDRMAAEGVRYTDFYAGGPVCAPARCTLLTGMHTGRATVRNNPLAGGGGGDEPLAEDEVTFGHVLQSAGYRTALFGKWGFSPDEPGHHSHPNAQGFDEFYGYLTHIHAHQYFPEYLWHNQERVEVRENVGGAPRVFAPDLLTERVLDFVSEQRRDPFLVFWSPTLPHAPNVVPDYGPYADMDWRDAEKAHAAQITHMDSDIGRLLDRLDELGIAEDTVVMFCGDHGAHEEDGLNPDFFDASGPFRGYKRNLLEGGLRTPAITWAPGLQTHAGVVNDQPWAMWDVLPTFAALGDAPVPPYIDGLARDALVTADQHGRGVAANEYLYWWRIEPHSTPRAVAAEGGSVQRAAEAVRQDDWKALRYAPGADRSVPDEQWQVELYDLSSDPAETENLAGTHPEVINDLVAVMHQAWQPPPLDRETWAPDGLALHAPPQAESGEDVEVTVWFTNHHERLPVTGLELELVVPDGWSAVANDGAGRGAIRPGRGVSATFTVSATDGRPGRYELSAVAAFRRGPEREGIELARPVTVALAAAPFVDTFDDETPGAAPAGYLVQGPAGSVTVEEHAHGRALVLVRESGSQVVSAVRPYGEGLSTDYVYSVRARAYPGTTAVGIWLVDDSGRPVLRLSLAANGEVAYTDGAAWANSGAAFPVGSWMDLEARVVAGTSTYDVFLDGDSIGSGLGLERAAHAATHVRVQVPSGPAGEGRYEFDRIAVGETGRAG